MLTREKPDGSAYRQVLSAMITNDAFLAAFASKHKADFFDAAFARKICQWCLDFHAAYSTAPCSHIQDMFDDAVRKGELRDADLRMAEDLLNTLSEGYAQEVNVPFLMTKVTELQVTQDTELLRDELTQALDKHDMDYARALVLEYRERVTTGAEVPLTRPFVDGDVADEILAEDVKPMLQYPGALGELVNPCFVRDALVYINASAKAGKTFWLTDIALRACCNSYNVLMLQAGDMTKRQFYRRLYVAMSGVPRTPYDKPHFSPCIDCEKNRDDTCPSLLRKSRGVSLYESPGKLLPVQEWPSNYFPCDACAKKGVPYVPAVHYYNYKPSREFDKALVEEYQKVFNDRMRGKEFRMLTYPNNGINVGELDAILREWKRSDGYVPDFIVGDYAGLLKAEKGTTGLDPRFVVDARWKALRRMSQEWNACVVFANQSDAAGYGADYLTLGNFSDSRTINDHVTAGIGLCRTPEEKKRMLCRVNVFAGRESPYGEDEQVVVLQDLSRGAFCLDSYWKWMEPKKPVEKKKRKNPDD